MLKVIRTGTAFFIMLIAVLMSLIMLMFHRISLGFRYLAAKLMYISFKVKGS
ncbi:MAG: hypothetical protein ACFFAU_00995 [Candidatus Hodarchaeota archaeon]